MKAPAEEPNPCRGSAGDIDYWPDLDWKRRFAVEVEIDRECIIKKIAYAFKVPTYILYIEE